MTTAPLTQAPPRGKRWLLLLAVLLTGAGVGGYFLAWPRREIVAPIPTQGLDAEVVAAIDQARAGVEARPKSAAAWGRLGMVLFAQDRYADCVAILAEAERLDPGDPRWPYLRGLALILQKPAEGIAALERAAEIPPPSFPVRLRLAEEYLKLDRIDEADALFRALLAEEPDHPRALLGRGQILSRRGQWREALAPLKTAAGDPTARRSARVALAETYLRLGDAAEAEAQRKHATEALPDLRWADPIIAAAEKWRLGVQARLDRALQLAADGEIEEATALVSGVLRDHPDSDEAHLTMAKVLIRAESVEEAARELRRALELNPDLVDGHLLLGWARMQAKDFEGAERSYLRTIELKPTYGLAHYNLGDCRLKRGHRAGAIDAFRDAVRYRPDLAGAHLDLGALLLEDGKVEEAITYLENAVRLDGKNDRARSLLEQARAKKGP